VIHLEAHPHVVPPVDYIVDSLANRRTQEPGHRLVVQFLLRGTAQIPKSCSLASKNAPIFDQGPYGSCTGHGSAQALYTTKRLSFIPSPRELYTVTRCLERSIDPLTRRPVALTDSGTMPTDLITTISSFGVLPMGPMANDGRQSDVDDTNINAEPDLLQLEAAGLNLEIGLYRIDERSSAAVDQIVACIAHGIAVGIGFACDLIFQNYNPSNGPLDSVNLNDPTIGGHWVCFDEYDTLASGKRVLTGPNSWSKMWGVNGRFSVTENWFHSTVSDAIPFAVEL
jgi:hypothetical protein